MTVGWTTRNQGNAPTTGSWVESADRRQHDDRPDAVQPGRAVRRSGRAGPLGAPRLAEPQRDADLARPGSSGLGQFRFTVTTDSTGQVFENNAAGTGETNNTRRSTIVSAPDLQVANLATTPRAAQAGGTVTVSWADLNAGTAAPVAGWSDRIVARNLDTGEVARHGRRFRSRPPTRDRAGATCSPCRRACAAPAGSR